MVMVEFAAGILRIMMGLVDVILGKVGDGLD